MKPVKPAKSPLSARGRSTMWSAPACWSVRTPLLVLTRAGYILYAERSKQATNVKHIFWRIIIMKKLLAILLSAAILLSFAACGDGGKKDDPNLLKIGDYEALYTGCEIVKDYDGDDTVVINFTFTNNSKEAQSFEWAYYYEVKQGDEELDYAVVFVSEDSYDTLDDGMLEDVAPGQSKDIQMTYKLKDLTTNVVVEVSDLYDEETDSVTIDLSTAK